MISTLMDKSRPHSPPPLAFFSLNVFFHDTPPLKSSQRGVNCSREIKDYKVGSFRRSLLAGLYQHWKKLPFAQLFF